MSEELKTLKNIDSKLDQLLKWTRFAGMQQLRTILAQNLTTDKEALIYELSDGERSTREIAELSGVGSNATVANYWRKWSKLGIVEPSERHQGRFRRICSLEEVGLTVPPIQQAATATVETEQLEENVADERQEH
jgi:transposase-like protein